MNNTKKQSNKQDQKDQRQKTRLRSTAKKQGRHSNSLHNSSKLEEHEHPELRMFR